MIAIIGCGDVGSRIAKCLVDAGTSRNEIYPVVRTSVSQASLVSSFINTKMIDLDQAQPEIQWLTKASEIYYLVPPQKEGFTDQRSMRFLTTLSEVYSDIDRSSLKRLVLISTTGVYGDCQGQQVTEDTPLNPTTLRSKRRADMEKQWIEFSQVNNSVLSILRVPGIYSFSRLPRARLKAGKPIVDPAECGYTNRIHADDLAMICQTVMKNQNQTDIYNVSDGMPGKMSEYFIEVAKFLGLPAPNVVSFAEAEKLVTTDMISYLRESRKISNEKILNRFDLELNYVDYRQGIQK